MGRVNNNGYTTFDEIIEAAKDKLVGILRNENRANALINAISNMLGFGPNRLGNAHLKVAKELGMEKFVKDCNEMLGTDYENAVFNLLNEETSWIVQKIDEHKRQNVPDLLITLGDVEVLIECKTCTKKSSLINKEEAFAILQKAIDFDQKMRRVTLGKPAFDEHSKTKAQAASDITLIEHHIFMEGLLRVMGGTVSPKSFLQWLRTPGVSEIERLDGKATYSLT